MKSAVMITVLIVLCGVILACAAGGRSIRESDCDYLASHWKGKTLQYGLVEAKVLKIYDVRLESKDAFELICTANFRMSHGPTLPFQMTYSEDADGDLWHEEKWMLD